MAPVLVAVGKINVALSDEGPCAIHDIIDSFEFSNVVV